MAHHLYVRPAETSDIPAMLHTMAEYMDNGTLLARDEDDLCQHLQEFMLAFYDGKLAGVVALHIYARDLAEVRSLVVVPMFRACGVGVLLIEACENMARIRGISRIFALTYVHKFFVRLNYQIVARESLPHKIWTVCIHCPRFSHCDETAVEKTLKPDTGHAEHLPHILDRNSP